MDRRNFIQKMAFTALAVSVVRCTSAAELMAGECDPTTKDILGPFYREGAPFTNNLRLPNDKENLLKVSGLVTGTDECGLLEDVLIEIWHANPSGDYDNHTDNFYYRCSIKSNKDGYYSFQSIMPGKYLNGRLYRPSHVHFRVSKPGYKDLISQIYFEGDTDIPADPWASDKAAENRILALKEENGEKQVTFDIVLQKL